MRDRSLAWDGRFASMRWKQTRYGPASAGDDEFALVRENLFQARNLAADLANR